MAVPPPHGAAGSSRALAAKNIKNLDDNKKLLLEAQKEADRIESEKNDAIAAAENQAAAALALATAEAAAARPVGFEGESPDEIPLSAMTPDERCGALRLRCSTGRRLRAICAVT